jgi:glycosyltransferase involved in cell wall biosynthesis
MTTPTVLLINKFYHDKGRAGGVGRYILQEEEDLQAAGWSVVPFAMADDEARPSPWDRFFVKAHDYSQARLSASAVDDALSLIWNREAARNLDALLHEVKPQVAHIHNIYHHLSPSILPVLARHGIPVVMTLHDLRLLCPAIHMVRQGEVCERCKGGRFHEAVLGRCVKGSRAASLLAAVETANQSWRGLYKNNVRRYLCPSAFYAQKFAEWGYPADRLLHLPNFVDLQAWQPSTSEPENSCLYFGRLSNEKGLDTLLKAHERLCAVTTDAPILRIAGSGPAESALRQQAATMDKVEFLGPLDPSTLQTEIQRSLFTVLPSQWYENGPLSLLESLAAGVPVVGADIGGIPEFISHGEDGLLFASGDVGALAETLQRACALPREARSAARRRAETQHDRADHMRKLMSILSAEIE